MKLIATIEDLIREATEIQAFLEITVSENPEEIVLRGNDLSVYVARTGKMLADAKYHRDSLLNSEALRLLKEQAAAPASLMNKMIDAACKETNYILCRADRLNRCATHQLDWCRTLISKAKEEMRLSGGA
jgi:hypothetical protein